MTAPFVIGFAAIAGILAGFLTARMAPLRIFLGLVGICTLAFAALFLWASVPSADVDGFTVMIVFLAFVPFTICVLVAGGIGLLARRIVTQREAP